MVGLGRVELPTSPLSGVRSSHLSYRPNRGAGFGARFDGKRCFPRTAPLAPFFLVELTGIEPATS